MAVSNNFSFIDSEVNDAKNVLDLLKMGQIEYNEFPEFTLNQLIYHLFVEKLHENNQQGSITFELSKEICDVIKFDENPKVRKASLEIILKKTTEANKFEKNKVTILEGQIEIISELFHSSLLNQPILKIIELAKAEVNHVSSKKSHDLFFTHLLLLKTLFYTKSSKKNLERIIKFKRSILNLECEAWEQAVNMMTLKLQRNLSRNDHKNFSDKLKIEFKNSPIFKEIKQVLDNINVLESEQWGFANSYNQDLEEIVSGFYKKPLPIGLIRRMINDLVKSNEKFQKKIIIRDLSRDIDEDDVPTWIQLQLITTSDLYQQCISLLEKKMLKYNISNENVKSSLNFPEFDFIKADSQKRKVKVIPPKKTSKFELDIPTTEEKKPEIIIEKVPEKKISLFKEISINAVEKNILEAIKNKKIDSSLILEFDYLFKLQDKSIYAKEANSSGHFKICSFLLFINELQKVNPSAFGVIPTLLFDIALQTEQVIKNGIEVKEDDDDIAHRHSLKKIAESYGKLNQLGDQFSSYINNYDYAIIWMRYLEHSLKMYESSDTKPLALKWAVDSIRLMQEIQKNKVILDKNRIKTILQLVDFVFESMIHSYSLLALDRKELSNLLKPWKEYLGVMRKEIEKTLNAKLNTKLEFKGLEKDDPINDLEKLIKNSISLDLKEALQHLQRMRIGSQLMQSYQDPVFNPWFERNLISPWANEALLKWMITQKGHQGMIATHDFEAMLDYLSDLDIDQELKFNQKDKMLELNIGITHHYPISRKMKFRGNSFKDYDDMIQTGPQYIIANEKENKRNGIDKGRLKNALNISKTVIDELVKNCMKMKFKT